jgi:histidyl-tRNA synthetase
MLRNRVYKTFTDLQRRSVKAQMRETSKLNAKYCIIIGEEETNRGTILIKNLKNSEQTEIKLEHLNTISFI